MTLWLERTCGGGRGGYRDWAASEWTCLQCDYPGWSPAGASAHEATDYPPAVTRQQTEQGCGGSRTRYRAGRCQSAGGRDKASETGTCLISPLTEARVPFPEDFCVEEDEEEAGDSQAWEEPLNRNTGTRNLAPPREMEPTLRRRCRKSAAQGRSHSPHWKEGKTVDGLVKQSLFL